MPDVLHLGLGAFRCIAPNTQTSYVLTNLVLAVLVTLSRSAAQNCGMS